VRVQWPGFGEKHWEQDSFGATGPARSSARSMTSGVCPAGVLGRSGEGVGLEG